jgi:hypothetical protein
MKSSIQLTNFRFTFAGFGHYKVSYQSPKTGKIWSKTITNMMLIDHTKNAEEPTKKALNDLKRQVKSKF